MQTSEDWIMDYQDTETYALTSAELLSMAADIAAAYVSGNQVELSALPEVLKTIYATLSDFNGGRSSTIGRPDPVVSIEDSVHEDYIVCLEDGKQLKMLKRHLKTAYNMTPEQYRERWGLSADYPMVAPSYARQRSDLAMKIGLGRRRKKLEQKAA